MKDQQELTLKTIQDFGEQWNHFTDNTGYYGSVGLLQDIIGPSIDVSLLKGKRVADIGSGTGRIVNMMLEAGVEHVVAVEPSDAFEVMLENTKSNRTRITYLKEPGDRLPAEANLDYVISLGVIHHIPQPHSTLVACHRALKEGGKLVIWLYGREGNELYLFFAQTLRACTKLMPHFALVQFSRLMALAAVTYGQLCRLLPFMPMHKYFVGHFNKLSFTNQVLTTYDQLNPAYAKYYKYEEALEVVRKAGFKDVKATHRHGYSWTVSGVK